MARKDMTTPEARARRRVEQLSAVLWHLGAYIVVNAFLWTLDIAGGGGLEWAYWTTIPWGVGLAFHILAYFIGERGLEERKYEQYLEQERERQLQDR